MIILYALINLVFLLVGFAMGYICNMDKPVGRKELVRFFNKEEDIEAIVPEE